MKPKRTTNRPGPKGIYRTELVERAYKLCLLGLSNKQIADAFGVKENTIDLWSANHPAFGEALKKGRQEADANVAKALYQRAIGYNCKEVQVFKRRVVEYGENGKPISAHDEFVPIEFEKHYPPDVKAAIKWLHNRQRDRWMSSDKPSTLNVHHTHEVTHQHQVQLLQEQIADPTQFSNEELELVAKLGLKNLLDPAKEIQPEE